MGGIVWVTSVTGSQGGGTSMAVSLPTDIVDNDGVFAVVMASSTLTPPAGWTSQGSVVTTGSSTTMTLYLYRKDTVVAANSGTSHTWAQASNLAMGVTYFVVRADSGVVRVREFTTANTDAATVGSIALPAFGVSRNEEVIVTGGCTILTGGTYNPTAPTGFTKFTATSSTNYRLMAARATAVLGDSLAGTWTLYTTTANNGVATFVVQLSDQQDEHTLTETTGVAEAFDYSGSTYGEVLTDTAALHHILGLLLEDAVADTVTSSDGALALLPKLAAINDLLAARVGALIPVRVQPATAADVVSIAPALALTAGTILREGLGLTDPVAANQKVQALLADVLQWAVATRAGRPLTLAETIGVLDALTAAHAVTLVQQLGLADALASAVRYGLTLTDQFQARDALLRFLGAGVSETVALAHAEVLSTYRLASAADTIGVAAAVDPRLLIRITAADTVGLTAAQALRMAFAGQLSDEVVVEGAYVGPDGSLTTWALNTRTGAVSEYGNYAFNSFARVGNRYIGASASGLYDLTGDDDAGTPVVAVLKGGFLQFGGTHLSRLKAAYIAATGDEDTFVLKIETLDGATHTYQVDTRSGRNTKVHMGKGMRARYFAYTLTSTGQDFTLDTLEFVPVVVQRRV